MKLSLKQRLTNWLQKQDCWIASGELQRVVAENTTYTPQNTGRRLRELENEGVVEVKYERGHAYYRFKKQITAKESVQWFDSLSVSN